MAFAQATRRRAHQKSARFEFRAMRMRATCAMRNGAQKHARNRTEQNIIIFLVVILVIIIIIPIITFL